jgi:hypothetical protein
MELHARKMTDEERDDMEAATRRAHAETKAVIEADFYKRGLAVGLLAALSIVEQTPDRREAFKRIRAEAHKLDPFGTPGATVLVDGEAEYNSWLQNAGDLEMASWHA